MTAPVPILLLSHSLGHGGGERQLALTALGLDRAKFAPHVGSCEGGFWDTRLRERGVPRFVMEPKSLLSVSALREALRLRAYIQEHGIRIVQTFDYTMNVLAALPACTVPGVPVISNLRCHMDLIPRKYRWLNHMAHRFSEAVVVNSAALRTHLSGDYGIENDRIFVCYNGLDTAVFHPRPRVEIPGLGGASVVIGTVCVLRPEKNLGLLIEAFARVAHEDRSLRLLIVGSGPEEASLRSQVANLGVADLTVFHPSTPDVTGVLSAIDVFVLPSLSEGLSNALMEAMACGCCVAASAVGGNPELVEDGVTGVLFPSRNLEALTSRLTELVGDAEKRRGLGAAGAEKIARDFSLSDAVHRMQTVYEAVLCRAA